MPIENQERKAWLYEISLMRLVLLILLVLYHAFAPYVGTWDKPNGVVDIEVYRWIGLLSRAFRLEGFVFISGYIFTFQVLERRKFEKVSILLKSKIERLLIPSFIFSAIYLLFYGKYDTLLSVVKNCDSRRRPFVVFTLLILVFFFPISDS